MPCPGNDALACGHAQEISMFHVSLSPVLTLLSVAALLGAAPASDADPADDTDAGGMIIHAG